MEKGFPSTPADDSTQGSCPVQDRASQPSPPQIPPSFVSDNTSKPTKSSSSTDLQKLSSSSSQHSANNGSGLSDSPAEGSPFPSSYPILENDFLEDSTLASERTPLECSHQSSPIQISSIPKESAAKFSCNTATDSTCSSKSTTASAATTVSPMKRSFASMAKLVILQEKLRKAQKRDANDEEEGEISFISGALWWKYECKCLTCPLTS